MLSKGLVAELQATHKFFRNTVACLDEGDSAFRASDDSYSVASHVSHTAQSIDWFIDGMYRDDGFDMDFEKHIAVAKACTSFDKAMAHFDKAIRDAVKTVGESDDAQLLELLPEDSVLGAAPRLAVIGAIVDHTAHHRGALSVYARLIGKEPAIPYLD